MLLGPGPSPARVVVDAELGFVKGVESGLAYDVKGRTLYRDGAVDRKDVGFAELLTHCEPVGTEGQVCFDPISAEFGWLDASGAFAGDAWWVEAKQAWYDPTCGAGLDLSFTHKRLAPLAQHLSHRLGRWTVWREPPAQLMVALIHLAAESTLPTLSPPWPDLEEVRTERRDAQLGLPTTDTEGLALPADALYYRLQKHCAASPHHPLGTDSGYPRRAELSAMVALETANQTALITRLNQRAAAHQARTGQAHSPLPDPGKAMRERVDRLLDGLEEWHLLVQGEAPDLKAVGLLNFRWTPTGRKLDWWPIELTQLEGGTPGGFRLRNEGGPGWWSPSRLAELALGDWCAAGAP